MNNFFTLIYLSKELNSKCRGAAFQQSYSFQKGIWESIWSGADGESFRWVYSARQDQTALFVDQGQAPKRKPMTRFFEPLEGEQIERVSLAAADRLLSLHLTNGETLLFQPFGPRPNLYRTDGTVILEAFRQSGVTIGSPAPVPRPSSDKPTAPDRAMNARQMILRAQPAFPRPVIPALIRQHDLEEAGWDRIHSLVKQWSEQMRAEPAFRLLQNGDLTLLSEETLSLPTNETFPDANSLVRTTWIRRQSEVSFQKSRKQTEAALRGHITRLKRRHEQLEESDRSLERAETHERYGHILTANAHLDVHPGMDRIELPDPWQENRKVTIPLPGEGSLAQRAGHYYRKAKHARETAAENDQLRRRTAEALARAASAQNELEEVGRTSDLRTWEKRWSTLLSDLKHEQGTKHGEPRPWRRYQVDGWEVCVGKHAKGNDELLRQAHKEDLWLHARGSAGSHVIVRMDRKSSPPPERVRHQAARFAAWFSKQRHAGLVPVMITRKKYVTKPSGAAAGQVRVTREEVLMVPPEAPSSKQKQPVDPS